MQEFLNNVVETLQFIESSVPTSVGIMVGMLIIMLESMLPILPLAVFIALNMLLFGPITGFIISWIATILGCIIAFAIVRKGLQNPFEKKDMKLVSALIKKINKMSLSNFTLITALPFMPAFAINIAAGLSKMSTKKFIIGIAISKLVIVYFWGFIGTTLIQSITDITVLIKVSTLMTCTYIASKIIMKKFKLD